MKLTCPNCGVQGNLDLQNMNDGGSYLACPVCRGRFNVRIRKDGNSVIVVRDLEMKSCSVDRGNMRSESGRGPFLWLLGMPNKHKSLAVHGSETLNCVVRSS